MISAVVNRMLPVLLLMTLLATSGCEPMSGKVVDKQYCLDGVCTKTAPIYKRKGAECYQLTIEKAAGTKGTVCTAEKDWKKTKIGDYWRGK